MMSPRCTIIIHTQLCNKTNKPSILVPDDRSISAAITDTSRNSFDSTFVLADTPPACLIVSILWGRLCVCILLCCKYICFLNLYNKISFCLLS